MGIPVLGSLISGVSDIIQVFKPSPEQKAAAESMLKNLETEARQNLLEHEQKIIHERAAIIRAEAGSDSWLAKSWRPIMMVNFGFLITVHWFGFTPENLSESEVEMVMDIIRLGLGGYVVGRSVEKIVPMVRRK